jgi:hypothetical protein
LWRRRFAEKKDGGRAAHLFEKRKDAASFFSLAEPMESAWSDAVALFDVG